MASAHPVESAPPLVDAAGMFPEALAEPLQCFATMAAPHIARVDICFGRRLKSTRGGRIYDALQLKALFAITPGVAAHMLSSGRQLVDFFEQVSYHSRRLAKLNVSPSEVVEALREYDRILDPVLANRYPSQAPTLARAREQLHFCSVLTVNNAFYQVREAETQAFYGLLRAEMDAQSLDDLLRRFIAILTRTFHAQAGRLIPLEHPPGMLAQLLKRLERPRYIRAGSAEEELILDAAMRGQYMSYWSIPFSSEGRLAGLLQFGFPKPYRWLPRELDLMDAFAERCLRAAERAKLLEELAARGEEVRELAAHLMHAEEQERHRLSRELHDEAGQSMLFLRLHLEMLEKIAPPELGSKLTEARLVAEGIISETRRIIAALTPSVLDQLGLPAAIRNLTARFRQVSPIKVHVRLSPCAGCLTRPAEVIVYRVVQECYQNIARHSGASQVNVRLHSTDRLLELNVEDDGAGFDVEAALARPNSFGLKGMRERIALLGGRLEIRSTPGHGARVSVALPLPLPAAISGSGVERDYAKNSSLSDRRPHPVPAGY